MIQHIYCCPCGREVKIEAEAMSLGMVVKCKRCKQTHAHVYPQGGGRAWVRVSDEDVRFHRLVRRQT